MATVRAEVPDLVNDQFEGQVRDMLAGGVTGMTVSDMQAYLEYVADRRLAQLGFAPMYGSSNPFGFLEMQDVQELSNLFERRVSAYQVAVAGSVSFDADL